MATQSPEQISSPNWLPFLEQTRWFLQSPNGAPRITLQQSWKIGPDTWVCLVQAADVVRTETYFVPLHWVDSSEAIAQIPSASQGVWVDALSVDEGILAIHDFVHGSAALDGLVLDCLGDEPLLARSPIVVGAAEQTNSWFVVGERFTKVFRRLAVGENLDVEVLRALAGSGAPVPHLRRVLRLKDGTTLCAVQDRVPAKVNGWELACSQVGELANGPTDLVAVAEIWRELGRATAQMHACLASMQSEFFAPVALDFDFLRQHGEDAASLGDDVMNQLHHTFLPETTRFAAELLRRRATELIGLLRTSIRGMDCLRIRVHGDYHLGQVLWSGATFTLLDFEGEPSRSVAQRRQLHPAVKDVAGMLRSFDYAARAGLPENASEEVWERALIWKTTAREAFLQGWRWNATFVGLRPSDLEQENILIARYELEKAFYELKYELEYRPDWVTIPLGGLLNLVNMMLEEK